MLLGLAASTARLPPPGTRREAERNFRWYLRPGQGSALTAKAKIVHEGRLTALASTEVLMRGRQHGDRSHDHPRSSLMGIEMEKIAVFGAGAVGCYYGGMLARAGMR